MTIAERQDRFGVFGGRYVPETLIPALDELEQEYDRAMADTGFRAELDSLLRTYVGRPSSLSDAPRFSELVGAPVYLKREDLNHTGAHKINNTVGQALLARRMGKRRIIAETGAGQHGVATATVCARFGFECVVYMGEEDMRRQALNVFRMRLMGAEVRPVTSGTKTLKDATSEAIRDWVTNVTDSHYIIGSVVGPAPYPRIVRDLQSVIGTEARAQMLEHAGRLPASVVACVGGGSNAMGIFHAFVPDRDVELEHPALAGRDQRQECMRGRRCHQLEATGPGGVPERRERLVAELLETVERVAVAAGLGLAGGDQRRLDVAGVALGRVDPELAHERPHPLRYGSVFELVGEDRRHRQSQIAGDRQHREMGADERVEEPFLAERICAEARDIGHVRVENDRDVADAPIRIATAPTLLSTGRCRRRGHSRQTATKSSALSRSASPAGRSTKSEALIAGVKRS